jgi:hypothetical protein
MPRLKIDDDDLDVDELESAEWDDTTYERYGGEIPPKDTFLVGYVKNVWWTETNAGDPMLKVLWIADGNTGDEEEYNGLPVWENLALTAKSKFKWAPFFRQFGLTVRMIKTKTIIAADDDNVGAPITKIGTDFAPGESARCAIITGREKYNNEWQVRVAEWLDEEEADEDEDELDDEEEGEEPEDDEDDDEEEETPPPTRTRRAASGKATASAATKPAATARPAASKSSTAKPAAKRDGTRSTSKAPAKSVSKATPAHGARKAKAAGYDDEPPF